ncbi:MAG: hypothetical protein JO306_10345 [Gemmatimonadetes bacterium]|nr:hypothetical protein [Gemmatimonadota bacterium]
MKRKLDLDQIDVTTFATQEAATALRGTVDAAEAVTSITCRATCGGATCNTSCGGVGCTCYPG